MSLSYYEDGQKSESPFSVACIVVNALVAVAVVFYWSGLSVVVAEPLKWATRGSVSPHPWMFEYPYMLLWVVPIVAACASWLALKLRLRTLAAFVGAFPLIYLGLMTGWFYLTPAHWH